MVTDISTISHDAILEIFKWLPGKDVIRCLQVCKRWKNVVDSHNFWNFYCKFHTYLDDAESLQRLNEIPIQSLKILIVKRAFNRNLLDDDYTTATPVIDPRWSDSRDNRNRYMYTFKIESPPNFLRADRDYQLDKCPVPFGSCLVSSYQNCNRHVYVDLTKYGLTAEFLKKFKPTILVNEYYTNRGDCSCRYRITTSILSPEGVQQHDRYFLDDSRFRRNEFFIAQWDDEYWRKIEQEWTDYDDDATIVFVATSGVDGQFWAGNGDVKYQSLTKEQWGTAIKWEAVIKNRSGNYGVKVAGTSIQVKLEFNKQR